VTPVPEINLSVLSKKEDADKQSNNSLVPGDNKKLRRKSDVNIPAKRNSILGPAIAKDIAQFIIKKNGV
jgi:hypothetical protein